MVEEARVGIEKACLNRLRESLLKSETRSTLIHILSRCYEDPNASRIFSPEPPPTRPGGGSGEGEGVSDGGVMKVDVVEDVLIDEVKDDEKPMEFTVDEFESMIMDIDKDVDTMNGLFEGNTIDQEALREVEDSLLESVSLGNQVPEKGTNDNGFSNVVEVGLAEGEVMRCGNVDDKCSASQERRFEEPDNVLDCVDAQRTDGNDDIEKGEIDKVDASVPSYVLVEDAINTLLLNETCADQLIDTKQRRLPGEVSCSEIPNSIFVGVVDKGSRNYHQTSFDACAGNVAVKLTSEAKINTSIASVVNNELKCPVDSRSQVFYGDILGEAPPPPQGPLSTDADHTKKRKRGGNSKEKKKIQKRKKRAEMDKKLGVKRMKLPQPLKPKVVKVCEHYLKGRCLKGGECTFSHDATPLTKSKACVHFARGNCMKGEACPYDHELSKYPCENYASKGFCIRGSSCLFSHEISAKEGSPGASIAEKVGLQTTPILGTGSKGLVNSSTKVSINTPMQVPKGLSFLSLGKSGSDQLTRPDPSRLPQKVDLTGNNPSTRNVPGVDKIVTSMPFASPVRGNNNPYMESQSVHSCSRKNSVPKASSSEKRVNLTNPLDQALQGLNSLVSSRVPVNGFSNECRPGLSAMEHNPPLSRFSGLNMHQSLGLSADKKKSGFEVVGPKRQASNSSSQVLVNMSEGATQAKESGVNCFSPKTSTVKPIEKLITILHKDKKSDKNFSIQDPGSQSVHVNPFAISAQELLKSPTSVVSPSSQGAAFNKTMPPSQGMTVNKTMPPSSQAMTVNKTMPPSSQAMTVNKTIPPPSQAMTVNKTMPSSQGMAVNQAVPAIQEPFLSTSTPTSKFESESKGSSLGSVVSSHILTKPEIASSSKSSSNYRPVKASAILDFIFGTGPKPSIR